MVKSEVMKPDLYLSKTALESLRRSWLLFALLSVGYLVIGWSFLKITWQTQVGLHWVILASFAVFYLLVVFWRNMDQNFRPGEGILLARLGLGNWTTLGRGLLVASLVGFLWLPRPPGLLAWLPAVIYTLTIVADSLDGKLARWRNHVTKLGSILDISFDGLGVLAAVTLLVQYGQVPSWYLLVGLARYLFVFGEWILRRSGRTVQPLEPSGERRIFASIQFVFIAVLLYPLFPPSLTKLAAIFLAAPFLAGFSIDFIMVSGVWRWKETRLIPIKITAVVPLIIRIALASVSLIVVVQTRQADLENNLPVSVLLFLQLLLTFLVLLGVAGRISSGLALVVIGFGQWFFPATFLQIVQIVGFTAIIYLGSGSYSLWSPEETWYSQRPSPSIMHSTQKSKNETLPQAN